jgi:predicted dehydrogenase
MNGYGKEDAMSSVGTIRRRDFLRTAGGGAAFVAAGGWLCAGRAEAKVTPNEKITLGLIGCGGMGNAHLDSLLGRKDVEIAAVCDVNIPRYEAARAKAGGRCEGYQDWRRVLDRKDIDAILAATPDHWHALMAVSGCEAGKDVYVEKPMTTMIAEGRRVVETARRCGRVVQVGIQQRSMPVFKKAIELIDQGRLGKIVRTRAWVGANGGLMIEHPQDPPPDLDWDLWLGPAPWAPYSPERYGAFRAFDDYAGGELTNWGVHLVDIALWGMKQDRPLSIQALGGSYPSAAGDDAETVEVLYEFEGCTMTWTQSTPQYQFAGKGYGTMFEGTAGRLAIDRASFVIEPKPLGIQDYHSQGNFFIQLVEHHDNFFDCIRTRRRPAGDCEIGHRATTACLLGNIAIDCRRRLEWDGGNEQFIGDEAANRHLWRPYRAPWRL